jgi:SAM-dependent methyltransferase
MDATAQNPAEAANGYRWLKQDCPICEIAPEKFIGMRGGASHRENLGVQCEIWACKKCSLIFPNPMPFPVGGLGQHYNVDADEYFQLHNKETRLQGASALVDQAEKLLGRKGKLLDVGVGRGEILISAREKGWEAEGVEPSETFADYVEKRTGAKIWRKPIEEVEIPPQEFDVVILSAVLEHLYDPDKVIKNISRIMKSGGLLYLDVPNEKGLFFKAGNAYQKFRGRNWCVNLSPSFPPFHIFGFSPRSLRTLLKKYDLTPAEWKVYAGTSVLPSLGGSFGFLEVQASKLITALSSFGEMGTYIETWAVKK